MITKKDFELLAEHLGKGKFAAMANARQDGTQMRAGSVVHTAIAFETAIASVVDACELSNPQFDRARFLEALDGHYKGARKPDTGRRQWTTTNPRKE